MPAAKPLVLLCTCIVIGACGAHRARHTAPDESQPHITWEIRTGGPQGEAQQVCESAQPKPACTIPPSPEKRRFATIHLYLHSAKESARYDGTVRIAFIEGEPPSGRTVSTTVPPGTSAENLTVVGVVTSKPGKYTMSIALKTKHGAKEAPTISHEVDVVVR